MDTAAFELSVTTPFTVVIANSAHAEIEIVKKNIMKNFIVYASGSIVEFH